MNKQVAEFIFDVDGTLTDSRQKIDPEFDQWFTDFCSLNKTYLVTGSDYNKTVEQLGEHICSLQNRIYNCSGNEVRENNAIIRKTSWQPDNILLEFLETKLKNTTFNIKAGNHIELRTGSLNYSTVGRNANAEEREAYKKWDTQVKDRELLVKEINSMFHDITAVIGGDTGIDIYKKGSDKSQILQDFLSTSNLRFFADKATPGGNDYPLAIKLNYVYNVKSWRETWEFLIYLQELRIAN